MIKLNERHIDVEKTRTIETTLDRRMFPAFAKVTRDTNPLHTNLEYAQSQGLRNTPAQGVLIQSYFEQCALTNGFPIRAGFLDFRQPAYPGDTLSFRLRDFFEGNLSAPRFECVNHMGETVAMFSARKPKPLDLDKCPKVASYEDEFTWEDVEKFRELTKFEGVEEEMKYFPYTLASALIPAALLRLASDDSGKPVGTYKKFLSTIWRAPEPGKYVTDVYLRNSRGKEGNYAYNFAVVSRNGVGEVVSGKIGVASPVKLELEELAVA